MFGDHILWTLDFNPVPKKHVNNFLQLAQEYFYLKLLTVFSVHDVLE